MAIKMVWNNYTLLASMYVVSFVIKKLVDTVLWEIDEKQFFLFYSPNLKGT